MVLKPREMTQLGLAQHLVHSSIHAQPRQSRGSPVKGAMLYGFGCASKWTWNSVGLQWVRFIIEKHETQFKFKVSRKTTIQINLPPPKGFHQVSVPQLQCPHSDYPRGTHQVRQKEPSCSCVQACFLATSLLPQCLAFCRHLWCFLPLNLQSH